MKFRNVKLDQDNSAKYRVTRFKDGKIAFTNRLPRWDSKYWNATDYNVMNRRTCETARPSSRRNKVVEPPKKFPWHRIRFVALPIWVLVSFVISIVAGLMWGAYSWTNPFKRIWEVYTFLFWDFYDWAMGRWAND